MIKYTIRAQIRNPNPAKIYCADMLVFVFI